VTPWVRWKRIIVPKPLGGWGLKNIHFFLKSLAAKGGWRLITTTRLWTKIVIQKYIESDSVETWIRRAHKSVKGFLVIWKDIINSLIIREGLAWKIGNGHRVRLGADPWTGSEGQHILSIQLTLLLRIKGYESLDKLVDTDHSTIWSQGWKLVVGIELENADAAELERYIVVLKKT